MSRLTEAMYAVAVASLEDVIRSKESATGPRTRWRCRH
jgi:hypothetical protein